MDTVPELDLLWKYLVTAQFGRHGIEINIGSLVGVGSTSSVVISRGVERYVTEFSFGYTESMNFDASTLGTGQPLAFLRWQTQRNTASSNKKEKDELSSCLPISDKGWWYYLADNFEHHHIVRINAACLVSVVSRNWDDT